MYRNALIRQSSASSVTVAQTSRGLDSRSVEVHLKDTFSGQIGDQVLTPLSKIIVPLISAKHDLKHECIDLFFVCELEKEPLIHSPIQ